MKTWTRPLALALATTMLASASLAAEAPTPLVPGKPAGVHQALLEGPGLLWVGIAVIAAAGIAIAVSNDNNHTTTATTTSTNI